jgi:TRAP-type mannitol/chloroaromatic compound transport system substrate-binding protein
VAIQAEATIELAEFNYKSGDALDALLTKHKVQLRKFPNDMLKNMGQAAIDVVAEVGNKDPFTKKVYESFVAARKKAIGWSALGEQGYMNARSVMKL